MRGIKMRDDCVFCKLSKGGGLPAVILFQNEHAFCIYDKNPVAPMHALVISKIHFGSLGDLLPEDNRIILPAIFDLIDDYTCHTGIMNSGYRVVSNSGNDAGQSVKHLHFHVIGGATLKNDFGV
jgi:histidine triad (HIT) family protein